MKKITLALLSLLGSLLSNAQQVSMGIPGAIEVFNDIRIDPNGGTIAVGSSGSGANADCFLVKRDAANQVVWQRTIPNPGADVLNKVIVSFNGDYVACGRLTVNNVPRAYACRINPVSGGVIWSSGTANLATLNGDIYYDLAELTSGNIVLAGTANLNPNTADGLLVMINALGAVQWARRSSYNGSDEMFCVTQMQNGNIAAAGHYYTDSKYVASVFQLDQAGNQVAQNHFSANLAPVINQNVNSLYPFQAFASGANIVLSTLGATGPGNGSSIQMVYTFSPAAGTLTGNYYYHTQNATAYTMKLLSANDFILAQSSGTGVFVSRYTNGVLQYDRQIGNNTVSNINGLDVSGTNMVLAGSSPGNNTDAYFFPANINFPAVAGQCSINNVNATVVANAPATPVATNILLNTITVTSVPVLNSIALNLPENNLCPQPCPQNITSNLTKCETQNVNLSARAGSTYSWSPASGLSSASVQNPVCFATVNTTYTCTISNAVTGCTYTDVINVTINAAPGGVVKDTTICAGDTLQLVAPAGTTYNWNPNTEISSTTIQNPYVYPSVSTVYSVTVTGATGCSSVSTFNITVGICHCEDSCSWSLTGNLNVKPVNFIGSINSADFKVRTSNIQRMVVSATGLVGINTAVPSKQLHVNGEARISALPASAPNNSIVFANSAGDLKSLSASGIVNQYLSGNGTWQNLPPGGGNGSVTADQGCTVDGNGTVLLGAECGKGGGEFQINREVNMNNNNLYFNSNSTGKLYMGPEGGKELNCPELYTRLEINAKGLRASNDYISPDPSLSGLRFSNLTSYENPIQNRTGGVLSLDEDGDVIWVEKCCDRSIEDSKLNSIIDRLTALEKELVTSKAQATSLQLQLTQLDIVLSNTNSIILNQNVPNPFAERTEITYNIPSSFKNAKIIFTDMRGEIIKTAEIKSTGKGLVNVYAKGIQSGMYTYTLLIDGKVIESKKMIKL